MKGSLFSALVLTVAGIVGLPGSAAAAPPPSSSYPCSAIAGTQVIQVDNCYENVTWEMIPGSRQTSDATGTTVTYFGTNTVVRSGDRINFDIFVDGDVGYIRFEGNCQTSNIRIIRGSDVLPSATYSPTNSYTGSDLRYACSRSSSSSQTVPALADGMPYAQARQMILDAGWRPSNFWNENGENLPGFIPSHAEFLVDELGYRELDYCAPTGSAYCYFVFTNSNGRTLNVSTANNECIRNNYRGCESVTPVVVNRWWVE